MPHNSWGIEDTSRIRPTSPGLGREIVKDSKRGSRGSPTAIEVRHLSDDSLLLVASSAVREDMPFTFSISKKPPRAYSDFLGRARNYINAEASTLKKSGFAKTS